MEHDGWLTHFPQGFWSQISDTVTHLGPLDGDDPVEAARRVVEEGDVDGGGRGRDPRPLRLRVDVEDVGLAREDRLLPER